MPPRIKRAHPKHAPLGTLPSVHAWEIRLDETPKQFAYFATYRDLGPDRTIPKVAAIFKRSVNTLVATSIKHKWPDRARTYDNYLDAKIRLAQTDEIMEMKTRHSDMAMEMVLAAHSELRALVGQIRKADAELDKRRKEGEPDATRAPILTPVDIARMAKTGAHLERLTRGEATAVTKIETEFDTSGLSIMELELLNDLLAKVGAGRDAA